MPAKLSIIIPVYNDFVNLSNCLNALALSEFKSFEVIVVDDGSRKYIGGLIEQYRQQLDIRLIKHKTNQGVATARNTGAKNAKNDVLLFIDSDVMVMPDSVKKVYDAFKDPSISVYEGIAAKKASNKGFGPSLIALQWYYSHLKHKDGQTLSSLFFGIRKKVFDEFNGFNENLKSVACEEFELGQR